MALMSSEIDVFAQQIERPFLTWTHELNERSLRTSCAIHPVGLGATFSDLGRLLFGPEMKSKEVKAGIRKVIKREHEKIDEHKSLDKDLTMEVVKRTKRCDIWAKYPNYKPY